jgi:hypothetical protein
VEDAMKFDTGTLVVASCMVVFYIYIYLLRRGKQKRKRLQQLEAIKDSKDKSKKGAAKQTVPEPSGFYSPMFEIRSWFIVGPAIILMLLGLSLYTTPWLPATYADYWWVITSAGVLIFAAGFK